MKTPAFDRESRVAWLVDHQRRPRHRGRLPDADVTLTGGNPDCGDVVTVDLVTAPGEDRVAALAFEGAGCTLSQAAASILAERVNRDRPTFEEIEQLPYEELLDLIGRDIAMHRPRCATLALGVLKAALRRHTMDRKLQAAGYSAEQIRALRSDG
jgi:nitrogen fixation protein NifU and related proteins